MKMTANRAISVAYAGFATLILMDIAAAALFSDQRGDVGYWIQTALLMLPWSVWSGWIAWRLWHGMGWSAAFWLRFVFTLILVIGAAVSFGLAGARAFSFLPFTVMQAMRAATFLYLLALWPATFVARRAAAT